MSKFGFATASALAALLIASMSLPRPVMAEDEEYPSWRHRMMEEWVGTGSFGQGRMRRFAVVDANDDGRISDDEAAAQRELVFFAMDADEDGELTEEEFMSVQMGPGAGKDSQRKSVRQEAKRARFAPMDADKSGKVSKSEFMAEGKARFTSADADKDGVVTPWEFRSMHSN